MEDKPVIEILDTFKYSVNIQNDYLHTGKLNSFLPTFHSVSLIAKYLNAIEHGSNKSFLLSGAYGTGKSFLVSVMLAFVSGKLKAKDLDILLKKIDSTGSTAGSDEFKQFLKNSNKLIVFPKDIYSNFSQAISMGICECISENNLNISLESSFDAVIAKIKSWENDHGYFFEQLLLKFEEHEITLSQFTTKIKSFDNDTYHLFEKIYPEIMGGDIFIPHNSKREISNILQNFEQEARSAGYNGVVYVFDEFGRYLEQNINVVDVKQVQDAAEYCNSGSGSSLFLITHKDIFQYSRKISSHTDDRNEWEKVSGRFIKEHLSYEENNATNLISQVLNKTAAFEPFYETAKEFKSTIAQLENIQIANVEQTIKSLYPLNYITAKMLPELSQKLAQNERTLFSFLCGDEELALKNIFSNNTSEVTFISPAELFDYFEENFKFLGYDSREYKYYLNSKSILGYVTDKKEQRFVKTLAIFYIVNNFRDIQPSREYLIAALNISADEFDCIVDSLSAAEHISFRRHSKHYILTQDLDINVDKIIQEYVANYLGDDFDFMTTLAEAVPTGYELPVIYNDDNKITRYLKRYYFDLSQSPENVMRQIRKDIIEDGKIVYIFNITDSNVNYKDIINIYGDDLIIISPKKGKIAILAELKELEAINRIISKNEGVGQREAARSELLQFKAELSDIISNKISQVYSEYKNLEIHINKEKQKTVKTYLDYQRLLSCYLSKKYNKYVPINYELINKTKLTANMKKCRRTILEKLASNDFDNKFFDKTSADSSVARLVMQKTGIIKNNVIDFHNSDFADFLEDFLVFIADEKTIDDVYMQYASNSSEWGIRRGLLTFIISLIIEKYIDEVSISHNGDEVDISYDLYDRMEARPTEFKITYIKLSDDKRQFLKEIYNRFRQSIDHALYAKNQSLAIFNGLKLYLYSLPTLAQQRGKDKFKEIKGLFECSGTRNSKEFFFKSLQKIYSKRNNYVEIAESLQADIDHLDNEVSVLTTELLENVSTVLKVQGDALSEVLHMWRNQISHNSRSKFLVWLNSVQEKMFADDDQLMCALTEHVMGFDYYNWRSEKDITEFVAQLTEMTADADQECDEDGQFSAENNIKLSPMGKMLKQKLEADIKNMGRAVSSDELKNVLKIVLSSI